jgi:hypothetical protein
MADNMLSKEEQSFSNLLTSIDKNLSKQNRLLERINIYFIILIIMVLLGFVGYVLLHLPCINI